MSREAHSPDPISPSPGIALADSTKVGGNSKTEHTAPARVAEYLSARAVPLFTRDSRSQPGTSILSEASPSIDRAGDCTTPARSLPLYDPRRSRDNETRRPLDSTSAAPEYLR